MADGFFVRGFDIIRDFYRRTDWISAEKFHIEAARLIRSRILDRTSKGVNYNEKPFKGYSKFWRMVRKKKGLPTDTVNLHFTGDMLSALRWKADKERAVLFFAPSRDEYGKSAEEKAYYTQNGLVKRRFLAMSQQDIRDLQKLYLRILRKKLTGI